MSNNFPVNTHINISFGEEVTILFESKGAAQFSTCRHGAPFPQEGLLTVRAVRLFARRS